MSAFVAVLRNLTRPAQGRHRKFNAEATECAREWMSL